LQTANLEADMRCLVIESACDADLPPVLADIRSFQEILQNLLANAIRYSMPGGRITIDAAAVGESEVVISVADTGLGIPKSDLDRIFERFYRTDAARSRESGGTGLGLSIVKHLVEAHRGRIEVESELGHGSTFRVFLPQAQPAEYNRPLQSL
jgi:two-component system phosphate regulon sensor histidine kinase PhoR